MKEEREATILSTPSNKEVRRTMKTREEVAHMLRLRRQGLTPYRIAAVLGCSRATVVRYLRQEGWRPMAKARRLEGLETWLEERFLRHGGNADVVRQELQEEHGIEVSLRTVERAVQPLRQRLRSTRLACVRFESPPGDQLQIDFGSKRVEIAGRSCRAHVFVATLGYSRRQFAAAYRDETQRSWMDGMDRAFRHYGGVPRTVLMDNPTALVAVPRSGSRPPVFNERLQAFARYWGFEPRACHPYRAQTKGKDERSVGYVKRNALAGRQFASWAGLDRHLLDWLDAVADRRIHGSTGATPRERFALELPLLAPVDDRPPYGSPRELVRKVSRDCAVALDTNQYSVPWRLVGEEVRVSVTDAKVRVYRGSELVAEHDRVVDGHHRRVVDRSHYEDLGQPDRPPVVSPAEGDLARPLEVYESLVEVLTA